MSGLGSRFKAVGYNQHKSLIHVDGTRIIEHVLNMFPREDDVLFICNNDHLATTDMREILMRIRPHAKVIGIDDHRYGPVYAVMQAAEHINDEDAVMISYCDYGQSWDFDAFKKELAERNPAGAVPCYTGFHPHLLHGNLYAGVLRTEDGMMRAIREKHRWTENPEDSHHSGGAYYFRDAALMKSYFNRLMDEGRSMNGEFYVSTVYELMLEDNLPILVPEVTHFMQWGTPQDLEEYEAWSRHIHAAASHPKPTTDIPHEREALIAIPHTPETDAYRKSKDYWQTYFSTLWHA